MIMIIAIKYMHSASFLPMREKPPRSVGVSWTLEYRKWPYNINSVDSNWYAEHARYILCDHNLFYKVLMENFVLGTV